MSKEKERGFFEFNDEEKDKIRTIVTQWTKVLQDNQNENGLRTDLVICAIVNFTTQVCALSDKCSQSRLNEAFIMESIDRITIQALRNGGVDIDKQEEAFSKQAELFKQEQGLTVKPGEA